MNLYAYVGNQPADATDPSGEVLIMGCVGGAATSAAFDVGAYLLSGRKPTVGEVLQNAAMGCLSGAVGAGVFHYLPKGVAALQRLGQGRGVGAIEDMISGARKVGQSRRAINFEGSGGGMDEARAVFDRISSGLPVKSSPTKAGIVEHVDLPTGGRASLRDFSTGGRTTIQIDTPGMPSIKVRF